MSVFERVEEVIHAYVEGRIDLDALQLALASTTWDNPDAPDIANEAELLIAEYAIGHRSQGDLRSSLETLAHVAV